MIKINGLVIDVSKTFPDGTLAMQAPRFLKDTECLWFDWKYENDAELFALICLRRHFAGYMAELNMDYIPHARMDRVKNPTDVFTLKYFCEIINSLNFANVYVLDPHSNVSLALLDRVHVIDVTEDIQDAINECDNGNLALFFPDEGAMKRYADYFIEYLYAFGMKKRDWSTGKILGLDIMQSENISGKDVLIIDDICSKGGTFYHSAKALLDAGAKNISLYITHCENTILEGEIFKSGLIKQVFTTHSLVHYPELANKLIYV